MYIGQQNLNNQVHNFLRCKREEEVESIKQSTQILSKFPSK